MRYAVGKPGETVRIYVETSDARAAQAQAGGGEVCVEVDAVVVGATIQVDGTVKAPSDG